MTTEYLIENPISPQSILKEEVDGVQYKFIANTDDQFAVSKLGAVYSFSNKMRGKRIGSHVPSGYVTACIKYTDGKKRLMYVHRLVADAFIPNPENKKQVIHINEVKDDNRVTNLCWAAAKENCVTDSHVMKLSASVREFYKNRNSFGKLVKRVAIIDAKGDIIEISPSIQKAAVYIAEKTNKSSNSSSVQITGILQGRTGFRTVGGYKVRQATEEEYKAWAAEHMNKMIEEENLELSVEQVKKLNKIEGVVVVNRRLNVNTGELEVTEKEYKQGEKIENVLG